jgi:hypothetical protein
VTAKLSLIFGGDAMKTDSNPKPEIRNPKQLPDPKFKSLKHAGGLGLRIDSLEIEN